MSDAGPVPKARFAATEAMSSLWWMFAVRGLIALVLGIVALFWPSGSISILLRIAGALLVIDGLAALFGARGRSDRQVESGSGIVTILIGAFLLIFPSASAWLAFTLLGIWALVTGASYLVTWWRMPTDEVERDTARNAGVAMLVAGLVLVFWPITGVVAIGWILALVAFVVAGAMFFLASRFKRVRDRLDQGM